MWTEELQQQTRECFKGTIKGGMMKHFGDSKFGIGAIIEGKYVIHLMDSDDVHEYDTMEEMLKDGWAID